MNPAWISRRLLLNALALRLEEGEGADALVLSRESLDVVRSADDVVRASRRACARRLRAARERARRWRQRAREQCLDQLARDSIDLRDQALVDATRIAIALNDEREQWRAAAEIFLVEIAHRAARRLLLELPADQQARSSACLLRDEWRAMRAEGQPQLRAHPEDLVVLQDIAADAGWSLAPDALLDRGHCVLSHPAGSLHARYDDNVHALLKALPGARDCATPAPPSADNLPSPFLQETPHDLDHFRLPTTDGLVGDLDTPVPGHGGHRPR